jgi:hypothetical protein
MKYNLLRGELLALFDEEDIIDNEAKIYHYKAKVSEIFLFTLYISWIEGFSAINLKHKDFDHFIFDIGITNIEKIECINNQLFFYKETIKNPILSIRVNPFVSLSCDL